MQHPIVCFNCAVIVAFNVPELTDGHWHTHCPVCGGDTELNANLGGPEELALFSAAGAFPV